MYSVNKSAYVSVDLETDRDGKIRAYGAVRPDTGRSFTYKGHHLADALERLDEFAKGASYLLGHNLIKFDLPLLRAAKPDLHLLRLPCVDTLRLSPLAFPKYPYHALVKHYQDGSLKQGKVNDPELDARLAIEVFSDQQEALSKAEPDLLTAWHWLCTPEPEGMDRALDRLFSQLRHAARPSDDMAKEAIARRLQGAACKTHSDEIMARADRLGWNLSFALAWLSVSGGNSVIPPWVLHQFPEVRTLVSRLRDTACGDPECGWCQKYHDARKELNRWFNHPDFRPEPTWDDGRPMQQAIVEGAMARQHVLGILPTGTGKSLCYQIPALSRYYKTGALTVVISPLVALMADQVSGMEKQGISCCVTVNGLLSMPERAANIERVRLGDAGILLISPEQLRSRSLIRSLEQRVIGAWVLDEAHCLSRWGHDFRPDYRYVGRFIKKRAGEGSTPPILCLTATAKPAVVSDLAHYFRDELDIELSIFNGGAERKNLSFSVIPTTDAEKFTTILRFLEYHLPSHVDGGAIIYCATRRRAEEIAEFLQLKEVSAGHFHAGLPPETKKDVQSRFIAGELRVIAATNAFGMGIDKPDVRLVIHADIPGSLENYLQEAGRAGRDRKRAHCALLYSTDDVERQFGMSARSRLTRREIHGILRALRNLDHKKRFGGKVVATSGEILGEDEENAFERDTATDDTRVRTAVAWLEESRLLSREENVVQLFPSSLRVESVTEARSKLAKHDITVQYRDQLLRIAESLIGADPDDGISTDELMTVSGLNSEKVRAAMYDLERIGIASNDTVLTAFIHKGVARSSRKRFEEANALESALISQMREAAPDLGVGDTSPLHLRIAAQNLWDKGFVDPLPERLQRIIRSIAYDGRGEEGGGGGSVTVRRKDSETSWITLNRKWEFLEQTAELRREAARILLEHLLDTLPTGDRGTDLLAETTLGKLLQAIKSDLALQSRVRQPTKLLDRALLWLHEQEVIRLNKGLAVFRPAMTIQLERREARGFANADFEPLAIHYNGQILQIHVMKEFAERGLEKIPDAVRLSMDYFRLNEDEFLSRWLPGRERETRRQTTPESWRTIVESLKNPIQQRIVADNREEANVLVLAGPGSGKTRVLVHRIAWLVRVRRESARSILALAYNRHAAVEIRRRLAELVGDDARGVTVLTCHALAMRLAGASFSRADDRPDDKAFKEIIQRAVALLQGKELTPDEADERRERLLAGFRWILVDEYQDIGAEQYELISAIAGRTQGDESKKLTMFAVGDDDQNIYAFNGTSVEFIRRFEKDYEAKPSYLIENYRSTRNIIEAANTLIAPARDRMKVQAPIRINRARSKDLPGGAWTKLDPVSKGQVQVLSVGNRDRAHQAQAVMEDLLRLSDSWNWSRSAIIARKWEDLIPVQAYCEAHAKKNQIRAQMANQEIPSFWRMRETRTLVEWLRQRKPALVDSNSVRSRVGQQPTNLWQELLQQAIEEHALEVSEEEVPVVDFIEWLAEWGQDIRRRQRGLLLLTAHRAKGLEFDHVTVLDGDWAPRRGEDSDSQRRLYYVAMTRAQETLTLVRFDHSNSFVNELRNHAATNWREATKLPPFPDEARYYSNCLSLEKVDLGYAGRHAANDSVHRAIAGLKVGDDLRVHIRKDGVWTLRNDKGRCVGRLARSFEAPLGMCCRNAKVYAIVNWRRDRSNEKYHNSYRCDEWEVVIPEMTFEPIK